MQTERPAIDTLDKVLGIFAGLAESPWTLYLVLWTVHTIAQPYAGITHDARLYSVQVLNRVEDGSYAGDIYFRYGSQDNYSVFSWLAAPLVKWLGINVAFFVIYLVSKALLIWGMMRIMLALVPNRSAAVLALIYVMAVQLYYAGNRVMKVQEPFATPRMPACAMVLLGLDLVLRGRPVASFGLILMGALLHPLMGFGGLLLWVGFHVWKYLGAKVLVLAGAATTVVAGYVLADQALGTRLLGGMDDAWKELIMDTSWFNFASKWTVRDWSYLAFQLVVLALAIRNLGPADVDKKRFLIILLLVTLAGAGMTILAEQLPYAVLLQGQAYRALWLLALLHFPLAFWLCIDWSWNSSLTVRLAGCVLLAYVCFVDGYWKEWVLPGSLFILIGLGMRGLEKTPRHADWLVPSLQISFILGGLGWAGFKFFFLLSRIQESVVKLDEYREVVASSLINLGPLAFAAALYWLLRRTGVEVWRQPRRLWMLATFCLTIQVFFLTFPLTNYYVKHCTHYRGDMRKIHDLIVRDRGPDDPLPTVYCNLDLVDYVWLDLHAKEYFDWWPTGNYMFSRRMAMEGKRRAGLIGPFDLAHMRNVAKAMEQLPTSPEIPKMDPLRARFCGIDNDRGPVNHDDLARLCSEQDLDYLVLDVPVEGLYQARAGRLYLYSCRRVRAELGRRDR